MSDMTDHAQRAYGILADWKLNGPYGYDEASQYLEAEIAAALTQAHADGRRDELAEIATRLRAIMGNEENISTDDAVWKFIIGLEAKDGA